MTPKEIIEVLQEYFKDKMDKEVRLEQLGFAFLDAQCDNKESLLEELDYCGLWHGINYWKFTII